MTLNAETFSIEFNIGKHDPITNIMLHVRGDDVTINTIELLCKTFKYQSFNATNCELINFNTKPNEGFKQWQAYRDRVIKIKNEVHSLSLLPVVKVLTVIAGNDLQSLLKPSET